MEKLREAPAAAVRVGFYSVLYALSRLMIETAAVLSIHCDYPPADPE